MENIKHEPVTFRNSMRGEKGKVEKKSKSCGQSGSRLISREDQVHFMNGRAQKIVTVYFAKTQ